MACNSSNNEVEMGFYGVQFLCHMIAQYLATQLQLLRHFVSEKHDIFSIPDITHM